MTTTFTEKRGNCSSNVLIFELLKYNTLGSLSDSDVKYMHKCIRSVAMDIEQPAKRLRIDQDSCLSSSELLLEAQDSVVECTLPDNINAVCPSSGIMSVPNTVNIGATNTSLLLSAETTSHSNVSNFGDTESYLEKSNDRKLSCSNITQSETYPYRDSGTGNGSKPLENLGASFCETGQKSEHFDDVSAADLPVTLEREQYDIQVKNVYDLEIEDVSEVGIPSLQSLRLRKTRSDNKENVIDKNTKVFPTAIENSEKVHDDADDSADISEKKEENRTDVCACFKSKNEDVSAHAAASKKTTKPQRRVSYIYSKELIQQCNLMQKIPNRASMVHSLIAAYGILKYTRVVVPSIATEESLCLFHSPEYIEFLKKINDQDDEEIYDEEAAQFGLTYDCPVHKGVFDYALSVGGASVSAAEELISGQCDVAINWCGGWHHAQKDSASGFCYVNDIVLGILKLRERFSRVLYVDLDLHHGDGVQNAFYATSAVMTVSIHKYAAGFFPGSGQLEDIGIGKGKQYCINIPLHDGARDQEFVALFCRVIKKVHSMFQPEAVVCQCGADGLAGDPMDSFNLTQLSLGRCVYYMLDWALPTLLLGGGGYHHTNTARCWAFLTGVAVGKKLPTDIPDHQFLMEYGPDYGIDIMAGNRKDQNSKEYLQKVHRSLIE
ncbi:histone deacetylase 8-like isoform X2 [Pecten maximus]|uniref:histone deacetylase 8-like isoform X2 n=1 Tax=Pecten maximus TaxID=6579 RepID=UPI0014591000|nr:histone deacetylase 8-like isoform X2 [Pecten maximus]